MPVCIVKDCPNGRKDTQISEVDLHFFCLPQTYTDRLRWQKFSGKRFKTFPEHAVFCNHHFRENSIVKVNGK